MRRVAIMIMIMICVMPLMAIAQMTQQKTTTKKRKVERFEKGNMLTFAVGGGVSGMGYQLLGGRTTIMPAFTLQAEYSYYFNKHVGIGTGLHLSSYASTAHMTDQLVWTGLNDNQPVKGITDPRAQIYEHRQNFSSDWRERQALYELEIPVLLRLKYKPKNYGFFSSLGVKLGIPVSQQYKHDKGTIINSGYYDYFDLTLHDIPNRFETDPLVKQKESLNKMAKINALGYIEAGALIQLQKKMDLQIGAYAQVVMNNASKAGKDRPELGFATAQNKGANFAMNEYDGLFGTDHVSQQVHPWEAGIKIGISYYPQLTENQKKRKARKLAKKWKNYLPTEMRTLTDTVFLDRVVHDTIYYCTDEMIVEAIEKANPKKVETVQAQNKLDLMLSESVIWFAFDKYDPILEPVYILDSVANVLNTHHNIRVHVNGHASKIGSEEYNEKLSLKRAQAVAAILRKKGVRKEQIEVNSFGASEPFKYNTEHQMSKDQRVEIIPEIIE